MAETIMTIIFAAVALEGLSTMAFFMAKTSLQSNDDKTATQHQGC